MPQAAISTSTAIRHNADAIVAAAIRLQHAAWPELASTLTASQFEHMLADTRFHLDFLASSLWAGEPVLFADYVSWTRVLFENLGLPAEWISGSIECIAMALEELLSADDAALARSYIAAALARDDSEGQRASDSLIDPGSPHSGLAMRYLGAVVGADRRAASQMILDAAAQGLSVATIYLEVLQPVQKELGRLWQTNRISVAQEHFATAVTQMVMSQLYSYIFSTTKRGQTMVAACVGGELHEIGMRMVADFFEMHGWDTHYLGSNTPAKDIVETLALTRADVLALSATMGTHIPETASVIEAVRADPRTRNTKIIVGGYPFTLAPDLWKRVNADGTASDAEAALNLAHRLVAA